MHLLICLLTVGKGCQSVSAYKSGLSGKEQAVKKEETI